MSQDQKKVQEKSDTETPVAVKKGTGNRGFASMEIQKQREIASKGGKAAHASGHAHEFTSEEARAAGRKGGQAAHESGRAHEFTSEEARAAGRKGGQASHGGVKDQRKRSAAPLSDWSESRNDGQSASSPSA